MDLIAHIMLGIWFYRKFGYWEAILLSSIFDIDHFVGYVYDKKRRFSSKIPWPLHVAFRKRSWFHSFTGLLILLPFASLKIPFPLAALFLISHLLIDSLDRSGIFIFPPFTKKRIRGPLPVSYLWENPEKPKHYKKAHIPAIILIIILFLSILYGI